MYESKISDTRWIAYDIPGNVGWIAFLVGLILCFAKRPEMMENKLIFGLLLLDLLCGAVMLVGIGELISERLQKLDRVLPKKRLYRGYMLGYHDLKDPSVSGFFRFLAKLGDRVMRMQIVRIDFENGRGDI